MLLRAWQLRPAVPASRAYRKAWRGAAPQLFQSPANMESSKPSHGLSMTYATSAPATAGGQALSPVRSNPILLMFCPKALRCPVSRSDFVSYLIDSHGPYMLDNTYLC